MENKIKLIDDSKNMATPEVPIEGNKEKQLELSPEEQLNNVDGEIKSQEGQIFKLTQSVEKTKNKLAEIYKELGITQSEEEPPSVVFGNDKIKELQDEKIDLEKEKNDLLNKQDNSKEKKETETEKETEATNEDNITNLEQKEYEISDAVLEKLSELIQIKNNLQLKVESLKNSPLLKEIEERGKNLDEKRKNLEKLKNPTSSNSEGSSIGGSVSLNGSISFNGEVGVVNEKLEDTITSQSESKEEKKPIDLESEAENLIKRTEFEILKLEKEEMEFSSEGLLIKAGALDIESREVEAETAIWSKGGMDQKIFDETLQKINNPDIEQESIKDKDLFLNYIKVKNEAQVYTQQNVEFNKKMEDKQKEIDSKEASINGLDFSNEGKILEILNNKEQKEINRNKESEKKEEIVENNDNEGIKQNQQEEVIDNKEFKEKEEQINN